MNSESDSQSKEEKQIKEHIQTKESLRILTLDIGYGSETWNERKEYFFQIIKLLT